MRYRGQKRGREVLDGVCEGEVKKKRPGRSRDSARDGGGLALAPGLPIRLGEYLGEDETHDPLVDPPELTDPPIGHAEPTTRLCETCGTFNEWWIYNPFTRQRPDGWVRQSGSCTCSRAADKARDAELFRFERPIWDTGLEQCDLDAVFGKPRLDKKTFDKFRLDLQPRMHPMKEAAHRFAERLGELPFPTQGAILVGPPSVGKKHLLSAIAHTARRYEVSVVSLTVNRALEYSAEQWTPLGKVTLLCLADLLLHPLMPSELRRLDTLLEIREEGQLPTCFSLPAAPSVLALRCTAQKDAVLALLSRVQRLAVIHTTPPGVSPFTARMGAVI